MMESQKAVDVGGLSIAGVESYLQKMGWKRKASVVNPNALPYEGPLDIYGKPIVVVVPARRDLIDADRRLNNVIHIVSKIEAISPECLVQAMIQ